MGERTNGSSPVDNSETGMEWADIGGLVATQGHGNVWAWPAVGAHVWVHDPDAPVFCADVHGSQYHQRPRGQGCTELVPPPH